MTWLGSIWWAIVMLLTLLSECRAWRKTQEALDHALWILKNIKEDRHG